MNIYSLVFMAYFSLLSLSLHVASVYIVSLCVNTGDFSFSFIRIARTIACVSIFVVIFQVAELIFIHRKSTSPSTTLHREQGYCEGENVGVGALSTSLGGSGVVKIRE